MESDATSASFAIILTVSPLHATRNHGADVTKFSRFHPSRSLCHVSKCRDISRCHVSTCLTNLAFSPPPSRHTLWCHVSIRSGIRCHISIIRNKSRGFTYLAVRNLAIFYYLAEPTSSCGNLRKSRGFTSSHRGKPYDSGPSRLKAFGLGASAPSLRSLTRAQNCFSIHKSTM